MLCLLFMTTGSILLSIALFLIVALVIARPFLRPSRPPAHLSHKELLESQKAALAARLEALDFDAQTAKQDEEAYRAERAHLENALANVDHQLANQLPDAAELEIEAAVATLRQTIKNRTVAAADRFCTACGHPRAESDRFCAACGREFTP